MPLLNLGSITTLQKMTGVKFVARDTNEDAVVSFNGLTLAADQPGSITFANKTVTPDLPAGSTFTVDLVATSTPSSGPVTITATGQQGNGQPLFTTQVQITVTLDPSTPGVPTHWDVTPGAMVSQ